MTFFENVLGLKVLRHEEFDSGCEATCNGPYGGEVRNVFVLIKTYAVGLQMLTPTAMAHVVYVHLYWLK